MMGMESPSASRLKTGGAAHLSGVSLIPLLRNRLRGLADKLDRVGPEELKVDGVQMLAEDLVDLIVLFERTMGREKEKMS